MLKLRAKNINIREKRPTGGLNQPDIDIVDATMFLCRRNYLGYYI